MTHALTELQAAVARGFSRINHFQRARRTKLFPKSAKEPPGTGPL